jgi:hypothetical protein
MIAVSINGPTTPIKKKILNKRREHLKFNVIDYFIVRCNIILMSSVVDY